MRRSIDWTSFELLPDRRRAQSQEPKPREPGPGVLFLDRLAEVLDRLAEHGDRLAVHGAGLVRVWRTGPLRRSLQFVEDHHDVLDAEPLEYLERRVAQPGCKLRIGVDFFVSRAVPIPSRRPVPRQRTPPAASERGPAWRSGAGSNCRTGPWPAAKALCTQPVRTSCRG